MPLGAALARNDIAGKHLLAAKNFESQPLTVRVAAVAGRSTCFLMCHEPKSYCFRNIE
jgi:hypothetical protein